MPRPSGLTEPGGLLAREALSAAIDLGILAGAITAFPFLLWRFLRVKRWRTGLRSRLGIDLPPARAAGGLWIHTVSAGELLSVEPLLRRLGTALPGVPRALSVTTEAGHLIARDRFADIPHFFWPVDVSPVVRRVLARVRPRLVVLVELELWPNFLLAASRFGIPRIVVNGRITERTARRWARARPLARRLFGMIDRFAVQDETYAQRLRSLGVAPDRITVCGNLKFDVPRDETTPVAPVREQLSLAPGAPLLVAGCTHPGEEELLLGLLPGLGNPGLVLAPRHLERFAEVERAVRARGLTSCTLSGGGKGQVCIVDVFGRLESVYRAADVVVMGGTFVPHGGHNMLEPARWGKAVVFGGSIDNFRDCAVGLLARDAAVQVRREDQLAPVLRNLLDSPERRAALGEHAVAAWHEGKGAADRYTRVVEETLRNAAPR
jgi:3-deoxy-D-manno-octulosonic-acid transferase